MKIYTPSHLLPSSLMNSSKILSNITISIMLLASPAFAQDSDPAITEQIEADKPKTEQVTLEQAEPKAIVPEETPSFDPDAPEEAAPVEPSAKALASLDMIDKAIKNFDDSIKREGNSWQFQIDETQILVVSDPIAERMRIMVPIIQAESLNTELLARMMQANFDSALDARYAIANGLLWGTYIHPLTDLTEEEFLSGLGQTISIVNTFGTSFSSGTVVFGGGDSQEIMEEQVEEQEKEREDASFT